MKRLLFIIASLSLVSIPAFAGCGKKVASIGKVENYDATTKAIVIAIADSSTAKELNKKATLRMTPNSNIIDGGQINPADLNALVGKNVSVVSEHGKIDYVITLAPKG